MQFISKAVSLSKDSFSYLRLLGKCQLSLGRFQEAISTFESAKNKNLNIDILDLLIFSCIKYNNCIKVYNYSVLRFDKKLDIKSWKRSVDYFLSKGREDLILKMGSRLWNMKKEFVSRTIAALYYTKGDYHEAHFYAKKAAEKAQGEKEYLSFLKRVESKIANEG
jgi:tetratricopeptide (TPR) repeat protein